MYPGGVRPNFLNAKIIYDEFHVVKLIIEAMDNITRQAAKRPAIKVRARHLIRMNASKLSGEQLGALERSIEDYRKLAENYRFRNVFSDIYRQYGKESAWEVLDLWYHDAQVLGTQAIRTASKSIYSRREGILAWHDKNINNDFAKAVNNIQTIRGVARGFGNIDYFIAMVYLCNGRLEISFN